jgi:putative ABC transport system ATP-binding protein
MNLLDELNVQKRKTIIMVTHDPAIARYAKRIIRIVDGRIALEEKL